jgi:hypothetical protein
MDEKTDQDELEEIRQIRKKMLKVKKAETKRDEEKPKEKKSKRALRKESRKELEGEGSNLLDKSLTIKVTPSGILKFLAVMVIVCGIFVLGRWSTDLSMPFGGEPSAAVAIEVPDEDAAEVTVEPVEEEVVEETPVEEEPPAEEEVEEEPAEEEVEEEPEEEKEEPIITEYDNVKIELTQIYKKWHDTWGKIIGIEYKIINGEVGTIKPGHIKFLVEGYDADRAKEIVLVGDSREIRSGKTVVGEGTVPNGFSYRESATGDLSNVRISLMLYDYKDKFVVSFHKEVNLNG